MVQSSMIFWYEGIEPQRICGSGFARSRCMASLQGASVADGMDMVGSGYVLTVLHNARCKGLLQ